ncbi:hypothetical protein VI03_21050 [Burkholderia vietnamiensis]|uniref:hypothetical protein n=1 Tax=Burkholderia TaxID=32008 RepID=UPI000621063D|nr:MULTISPECIES: hypothetical protein [Burkholderia]KKI36963.1 hypothetical protein VI03_21050 [Burkholderia vietnamiensis]KVF13229.1 hypothetical protein WJ05_12075 [Burkholderia vietnamiensis]MDN7726271.1 hypothetical protein [Burkholderia gladioli]
MSITTIEDRFILLLKEKQTHGASGASSRGFWERLAQRSGISAQRWRKAFDRRQRPTSDMIEATGKMWPQHAFWLVTGITDAANGHVAPLSAMTFPERFYGLTDAATGYFRQSLALASELADRSAIDLSDDKQRMYAAERTKPLAHWVGSESLDVAYQLSSDAHYQSLREEWLRREEERQALIAKLAASPEEKPDRVAAREASKQGLTVERLAGKDPRTAHQSEWDLFYEPRSE